MGVHMNGSYLYPTKIAALLAVTAFYLPSALSAEISLNSEIIALSAHQMAEKTNTTGWCYAAVSRALGPLGVKLTGAAAYEAEEQLRRDGRFVPLIVFNVDDLRRGDIIVYSKSQSHPYGHIAVYEGAYREASDHLSAVTHTKNYGGAVVFRLANEYQNHEYTALAPAPAPDYRAPYMHRMRGQNPSYVKQYGRQASYSGNYSSYQTGAEQKPSQTNSTKQAKLNSSQSHPERHPLIRKMFRSIINQFI